MNIELTPGAVLLNGSIMIARRGEVVLCVLPRNSVTPYATWRISESGDTAHGDYFQNLDEAVEGFDKRAK